MPTGERLTQIYIMAVLEKPQLETEEEREYYLALRKEITEEEEKAKNEGRKPVWYIPPE